MMLTSLRLQNFRLLRDTGPLEFRPITILLGQNSSGKSSFLRSLALLQQSIQTRSSAPILWYGELVDFGSFNEVVSSFSDNRTISISLAFDRLPLINPFLAGRSEAVYSNVSFTINLTEVGDATRLLSFRIQIGEDTLTASISESGDLRSLEVNGQSFDKLSIRDRLRFSTGDIVPQISVYRDKSRTVTAPMAYYDINVAEQELLTFWEHRFDRRVSTSTIRSAIRKLRYAPGQEFIDRLGSIVLNPKSWEQTRSAVISNRSDLGVSYLRSLHLIALLPVLLTSLNAAVTNSLKDLAYVGPARATGERYYRHQELAVDKIDPQGQNLAMFLYSLPTQQKEHFSNWLEQNIGYSLRVGRKGGGHIQIELSEQGSPQFHNLADMGYGFSQVLPVLAQVWGREFKRSSAFLSASPFMLVEQPELHLHPAYQAKIADIIAAAVRGPSSRARRPLRFVVETHSEAMINRFGELIYEGSLDPKSIGVYLFHKQITTDPANIIQASFDESGRLKNWPLGFFSARS